MILSPWPLSGPATEKNRPAARVYLISLTRLAQEGCHARLLQQAKTLLAPSRQSKASAYRQDADQARSIVGGLLMAAILNVAADEDLRLGPSGKPELAHSGPAFNLTHSGDYVALAVSKRAVGIDIEKIRPLHPSLSAKYLTPQERALVESADEAAIEKVGQSADEVAGERGNENAREKIGESLVNGRGEQLLVALWTRKESLAKAEGGGLSLTSPLPSLGEIVSHKGRLWRLWSGLLTGAALSVAVEAEPRGAMAPDPPIVESFEPELRRWLQSALARARLSESQELACSQGLAGSSGLSGSPGFSGS